MNVLLDTHAFLWFVLDNPKLTRPAQDIIRDPQNVVLISPASYWEVAIKISLRKFSLNVPYTTFWQTTLSASGMSILPIEVRHTAELIALPYHHKDPFDRLIVAQSLADELPLVSGDSILDVYGVRRIW